LTQDPANSGLEPGRVNEKIEKVMTWCDPADPVTQQNPVKNPTFFCFFTKTTPFWIFFKNRD
jgi:hypothetical protein